jgi:hypothetical protein
MPPPERLLRSSAALALGLVVAVVVVAAGIRLEIGFPGLRVLHRVAASLDVVAVLGLAWMAWRARAERPGVYGVALLAIGLTALLSVVGIAAGQKPPPAGAAANLLGGLVLAAVLAWILGKSGKWSQTAYCRPLPILGPLVGVVLGIQLVLGARLSIVERYAAVLPVHALLAMVLAALLGWLALARVGGTAGKALFVLALAAPVAGFTSLHYEYSAVAALVHAGMAVLLLAATAYVLGRSA